MLLSLYFLAFKDNINYLQTAMEKTGELAAETIKFRAPPKQRKKLNSER